MNRFAKPLLVAAAAFGGLAAVSAAHARTDVVVSIGVPARLVQTAPVYVQPQPVYLQPQRVYHAPMQSRGRGGPWGDADRDGLQNLYDRDSRFYDPRAARQMRRDSDHDGVPNRFDRAPHNPYRR